MGVHIINGRWTVDGKKYRYMTRKDKELLSKVMAFKKEAYEANHKPNKNV